MVEVVENVRFRRRGLRSSAIFSKLCKFFVGESLALSSPSSVYITLPRLSSSPFRPRQYGGEFLREWYEEQSVYIVVSVSLTLIKEHTFENFIIFLPVEPSMWTLFVILNFLREMIEEKVVGQISLYRTFSVLEILVFAFWL